MSCRRALQITREEIQEPLTKSEVPWHREVPPFIKQSNCLINEDKQKSHFCFSCSDKSLDGLNQSIIKLISDTDGMLWKVKLDHKEGAAEFIPLVESFHTENGQAVPETGHIIYFPGV